MTIVKVGLYVRIGDSEVMNLIGENEVQVAVEKITPATRRETDAPEATERVHMFDLPGFLRDAADAMEAAE